MSENPEQQLDHEDKKPVDEKTGFYFSSAVKIHDPNTTEVLVQIRGDN